MREYGLLLYFKVIDLLHRFRQSYISLSYANELLIHPCSGKTVTYLEYEQFLYLDKADAFELLIKFANQNGYNFEGDESKSNEMHVVYVIFIFVTISGLLSSRTYADTDPIDLTKITFDYRNQALTNDQIKEYININPEMGEVNTINELTVELMNWINNNSSFDHKIEDVPVINKINQEIMQNIALGIDIPASVHPKSAEISGLYNINEKTIYLLDSFDIKNEYDRAILLHEIVHYLQFQYGDDTVFTCNQKLESFAYRLQAEYLFSRNQEINLTGEHIRQASRCH